jgi:hypothetical protein
MVPNSTTLQQNEKELRFQWYIVSSSPTPLRNDLEPLAKQWADNLNAQAEMLLGRKNLRIRLAPVKESRFTLERLFEQSLGHLIASGKFELPVQHELLAEIAIGTQPRTSTRSRRTSRRSSPLGLGLGMALRRIGWAQ